MRKVLWLAVVVCLIIYPAAIVHADVYENNFGPFIEWDEEFTLHADVAFGDTIEEAYQKELAAGMDCSKAAGDTILDVFGTIASVPDSFIEYNTDGKGKINRASYNLRSGDVRDPNRIELDSTSASEDFLTISEALRSKYGDPYYSSDGEFFLPIITDILQKDINVSSLYLQHEIPAYEAWILDIGNEQCVLIDHYITIALNIQLDTVCSHIIGYQIFDKEYVENTILDNIESNIKAEEQMLDDL